jgi:hypothetical protein
MFPRLIFALEINQVPKRKLPPQKRPYKTTYGPNCGHCETGRGAIGSAIRYLLKTSRKHAVIELPNGRVVDVWFNGYWGVIVSYRGGKE